jgi:hypothetical protein
MKTSPKMQRIITELAQKHGVDLSQVAAYLRLHLPGYERLTIENSGQQQVSVAHYFEQNGDLVADPDVVFFTGYSVWVPIEITQNYGYTVRYATLNEAGTQICRLNLTGQASLAAFSEQWAQNLMAQGWLEHGQP